MTHTFKDALTALANLNVSGIARNYAIDAVPESPGRAQLPALLVLPLEPLDDALFRERGAGFQAVAFSDGARTVTYTLVHLLLIAPERAGAGLRSHLPALVDAVDAYMTALGADVTLGGRLLEPARVQIEPGTFTLGDQVYIGCAFRHTWLLEV